MTQYRQPGIKKNIELRANVIRGIRHFFNERGYLEVETPSRIPAPAPEANIDAVGTEGFFLQPSPELCMKRLLAAGYEKIFQVCRCWRKGERGKRHLPELTMLEWYTAGKDYTHMMDQCRQLILHLADHIRIGRSLQYMDHTIDLNPPWRKLSVSEAFELFGSIPLKKALALNKYDEIMGLDIEPKLGLDQPVFLYDYPASGGALAKLKPGHPSVAERFELYIGGLELCNAFTELIDPVEQKARFIKEQENRKRAGKTIYPMPEKFLTALKDMPDAAGNALGIDRLVMLFADTDNIDDVVAFTPEEL